MLVFMYITDSATKSRQNIETGGIMTVECVLLWKPTIAAVFIRQQNIHISPQGVSQGIKGWRTHFT